MVFDIPSVTRSYLMSHLTLITLNNILHTDLLCCTLKPSVCIRLQLKDKSSQPFISVSNPLTSSFSGVLELNLFSHWTLQTYISGDLCCKNCVLQIENNFK